MTRLAVRHGPDRSGRAHWHDAGAIGGGGEWSIESRHTNGSTMKWLPWWQSNPAAPADQRWNVRYALLGRVDADPARPSLDAAITALRAAIDDARALATTMDLSNFRPNFERALRALEPRGERCGDHRDLAPEGVLDETSAFVLDACQSAWVFGGMGSWNDVGDYDPSYERVSTNLFAAITTAIVVATNRSGDDERG
jgi:hypothetical protein